MKNKKQSIFTINNKINDFKLKKNLKELKNFWNLGWLDNKARYSKTYLGEIWIAITVVVLSTILGLIYGDIFGLLGDGKIKYFSYLAIGITLWNNIADSMAIGSRFILDNSDGILTTTYTLRSMYLRKYCFLLQNLFIGLSSILVCVAIFNSELLTNYHNLFLPLFAFILFNLIILLVFSVIGCLIRDFAELVPLLTTLIFLSSPILYPASKLEEYSWIANYNILYRALDLVRSSVLTGEFSLGTTLTIIVGEILIVGFLFKGIEKYRYKFALWCD